MMERMRSKNQASLMSNSDASAALINIDIEVVLLSVFNWGKIAGY